MMSEFGAARAPFPSSVTSLPIDTLVYAALDNAGIARIYPGFDFWFFDKVIPGMGKGERRLITHFAAGALVGIAICKRTKIEKKLCTLWVAPQARGCGIALQLADDAFFWLGTTTPLFTVPEELLSDFSGLLRFWSFDKPVAFQGLYRPKRVEYAFNSHGSDMIY